jgi:hypothetical protein
LKIAGRVAFFTISSDYQPPPPKLQHIHIDSTEVPVYGQQEYSAYNGHFESTCYHPLLLFNREGDCLAAKLRPGNVHSAEGWEELLLPEIDRQQAQSKEVAFRGDAAFAKPELYQALEERDVKYAIRLPANDNLQRNIAELLTRPVGRPSYKPVIWFKSFLYQAASWKTARRVVAKVEFHFGELFPRVGFIVTNLATDNRAVVRFYNKRGTAEQWIKEGKQAVKMTRLSFFERLKFGDEVFNRKCCNFENGDGGRPERSWAARFQAARSNSWSMN